MSGKDFKGGSDDLDEFEEFDDPGYDEPEYDEPQPEEAEYDEENFGEEVPGDDGIEYEEDFIEDPLAQEGDDFMFDEEGNNEIKPKVYYYKDEENYEEDMLYEEPEDEGEVAKGKKKMSLVKKILLGVGIFLFVVILFVLFLFFTSAGREILYSCGGSFIKGNVDGISLTDEEKVKKELGIIVDSGAGLDGIDSGFENSIRPEGPRKEDYVTTFLCFGIEEIGGAANTDAILLVSINKQDNTIKLTSIMRDTYVNIPGDNPNKINSVYSKGAKRMSDQKLKKAGGAALLENVIENTFDVDISGYACVNFSSFEKIVDRLGGIDIELGEKEAAYLRKTNYISNPAYRTVQAGWNHMNGNQVLGYCRVRKVVTLGGANNDYGRTVRHRRVINAIISKFKSTSFTEIIPIMKECLGEIYTNVREEQIVDVLRDVFENSIFTTNSMRLPADEFFTDSGRKGIFNGSSNITYTLVLGDQLGKNIEKFHQFPFLDKEGETDTSGIKGAGADVKQGSGSSSGSSGSSGSTTKVTPTPEPAVPPVMAEEQSLVDEAITSSQQLGAEPPVSPTGLPETVRDESIVSTGSAIEISLPDIPLEDNAQDEVAPVDPVPEDAVSEADEVYPDE